MTRLFKPAEITTAKLKMALMGFQGSGKTYTGTDTAIGLVKMMQQLGLPEGNRPLAFADTEKGSRWVLPKVKAAGLKMDAAKTRAFSDLLGLINEAEAHNSVLLVDSLTHFWTELCDAYCAKKAQEYRRATYRLQFQDWAFLKAEWRKFTDRFVNSNLHIIVCGRAGFEYDFKEDDETHKKQLEKTGIKFKAEGEMGYEPDLLVLMERKFNMETKTDEHVAHVVKDRSTLLDGKEIADPTFATFLPHIECLNLAGAQLEIDRGVDTTRTSTASIPAEAERDRRQMERKILVDEINDLLMRYDASGTGKDAQKKRSDLLQAHFGTVSKTAIEEQITYPDLKVGYDCLHQELVGCPSRYSKPIIPSPELLASRLVVQGSAEVVANDMNDALPDHSAPPVAAKPDLTTVDANDMPVFLKRTEPDPVAEEAKLMAALIADLDKCMDLASLETIRAAIGAWLPKVDAKTSAKALKLMTKTVMRIMAPQQAAMAAE